MALRGAFVEDWDDETAFDVYQDLVTGVKRTRRVSPDQPLPAQPLPAQPLPTQPPPATPNKLYADWNQYQSPVSRRPGLDPALHQRHMLKYRELAVRMAAFARALERIGDLERELRTADRIELVAESIDSSGTIAQSRLRATPLLNQIRWIYLTNDNLCMYSLPRFYVPLRIREPQPSADQRHWPLVIQRLSVREPRMPVPGALDVGDVVLARTEYVEIPTHGSVSLLPTTPTETYVDGTLLLLPEMTQPTPVDYQRVMIVIHQPAREQSPAL